MTVHKIALVEGGPKRLEVRSPSFGRKTWDIALDGAPLGQLSTHDEAIEGKQFPLPDGTTLTVRLEPVQQLFGQAHRLRVELDGALLRDSPGHPAQVVRQGAIALWLVGGLNVIIGIAVACLAPPDGVLAERLGSGIGMAIEGALYVGFGYAASRHRRWALIAGLGLYVLDTLFSLASAGVGGWLIRVVVIGALYRAIRAHAELDRVDAASVAAVFR